MKKIVKNGSKLLIYIGILLSLSLSVFIFSLIYEAQLPKIVEEINNSAIGAILTAFVTVLLLQGQTETEMKREKDVKIFEEKVRVYSDFTKKMWSMLDDNKLTEEEIKEFRSSFFSELVFYLNQEQIEEIQKQINLISLTDSTDETITLPNGDTVKAQKPIDVFGEITRILKFSLDESESVSSRSLKEMFSSLTNLKMQTLDQIEIDDESDEIEVFESENNITENKESITNIKYWHFTMLNPAIQIKHFSENNWVLSLTESNGEMWRTNTVKRMKLGDIVFLFKRGGAGYIGAFKVVDKPVILQRNHKQNYSDEYLKKYDMYDGIKYNNELVANVIVQPIAYNYKGVGYKTVYQRTVLNIKDKKAVEYLLFHFAGNELDEKRLIGKDKLNETFQLNNIDHSAFEAIYNQFFTN